MADQGRILWERNAVRMPDGGTCYVPSDKRDELANKTYPSPSYVSINKSEDKTTQNYGKR